MKDYFLKPSGSSRDAYINYLLDRLTEFRKAGSSFGQKHAGPVNFHIVKKIIQGQLAWPLDDEAHFAETCAHIQGAIDNTILGRRNAARGITNFHSFEDHGKPKAAKSRPALPASPVGQKPVCARPSLKGEAKAVPQPSSAKLGLPASRFKVIAPEIDSRPVNQPPSALAGLSASRSMTEPAISALSSALECKAKAPEAGPQAYGPLPDKESKPAETGLAVTASQIATAAQMKRQAVQWHLKKIHHSGSRLVGGQLTKTWTVASLPPVLRDKLTANAKARQYRHIEHLLSDPAAAWQPPLPLADCAAVSVEQAVKLCEALADAIARRNDKMIPAGEFEARGLLEYKRVFGHEISGRHWQRLLRRTLDRDNGAENFSRLEIYLPENPQRRAVSPEFLSLREQEQLQELHDFILGCKNPAEPNNAESQLLWLRSFELYERLIQVDPKHQKVKRDLVSFLWRHAPALAASKSALGKNFDRKYQRWVIAGRTANALADRRLEVAAGKRLELPAEVRDQIIAHAAIKCGGRVAQAWRELNEANAIPENVLERYQTNPASKSYVPHSIRESVSAEVKMLTDIHHGPRQAKLNGAFISRDWSDVYAGDWHQSDDCTLPVYYYVPDGQGWFTLMRGQFLPMIDLRSTCILDFVLISERNYNALTIRSLITKVCDKYGLPRRGFAFENGIWRSAKILKGVSQALPSAGEVELGLRGLGLEFRHATLPRVKPIERVLGQLQNMMEGEPGYIGRNEQIEKFERVQRAKLEVEARRQHPSKYFYSEDQWLARLTEICEQYNRTKQDGKMTEGLSPEDAYAKFQKQDDPPTRLDASCRYLLATHKRPARVNRNGITLRFGKHAFVYRNSLTGRLVGKQVLTWFDPDCPHTLTVTDMDRQNPFCVPLSTDIGAMDATPEEMDEATSSAASHQSYARTRYSDLRAKFIPRFRVNVAIGVTAALGEEMNAQRKALVEEKREVSSLRQRVKKVARDLGAKSLPADSREQAKAWEDLQSQLNQIENGDAQ